VIELQVLGQGLLASGLEGWQAGSKVLAGEIRYQASSVPRQAPALLDGSERRRCTEHVAWALNAAHEAAASSGLNSATFATVFASSDGDGSIVDKICSAIASPGGAVSPIHFHNSVHNAAAGYWSIGAKAKGPSVALSAYDGSFAAGLLEAACHVQVERQPVLLVACDLPYPPPIHCFRRVQCGFATALALAPITTLAHDRLQIDLAQGEDWTPLPAEMGHFAGNSAAACIPLLAALARRGGATVRLPYLPGSTLLVKKSG